MAAISNDCGLFCCLLNPFVNKSLCKANLVTEKNMILNRSLPNSPRNANWALSKSTSSFMLGTFFGFGASSLLFLSLLDISAWKETSLRGEAKISTVSFPRIATMNAVPSSSSKHIPSTMQADQNHDGWRPIHVFVGDDSKEHIVDSSTIPADYYQTTRWFSQLRQDFIVSSLLHGKRRGYFVDLAANDAIRISNTYALERDFGWTGLCIEPNPIYWSSLSYRDCQVVAAVVGHERMKEVLFKFGSKGPQSGIVGQGFRNKEHIHNREEKRRFTVTLQEIFERFETPHIIDYLSLDVEGAEEYVMESFPFDKYRFNVLTIEGPSTRLQDILKSNHYSLIANLRREEETLWVHNDMLTSIDMDALAVDIPKYSERVHRSKA